MQTGSNRHIIHQRSASRLAVKTGSPCYPTNHHTAVQLLMQPRDFLPCCCFLWSVDFQSLKPGRRFTRETRLITMMPWSMCWHIDRNMTTDTHTHPKTTQKQANKPARRCIPFVHVLETISNISNTRSALCTNTSSSVFPVQNTKWARLSKAKMTLTQWFDPSPLSHYSISGHQNCPNCWFVQM